MHAKFTLKYSHVGSEDYSPMDITFEIPGDANIDQMLFNFECFLKACGFVFDGKFVQSFPQDELDGTLYEFDEEPQGGCMADFDKECGCESTSSPLEDDEYYKSKKLKEWNEGIAKLDNEQRQKCREEALKMSNLHYEATKDKKNMKAYKEAIKEAEDKYPVNILYKKIGTLNSEAEIEVKKNKWFHGICNPPSPDWKKK